MDTLRRKGGGLPDCRNIRLICPSPKAFLYVLGGPMPKNDYNDPEAGLEFPRLEARVQIIDSDFYQLQVWLWPKLGGPPEYLMNKRNAGNVHDAIEYLK